MKVTTNLVIVFVALQALATVTSAAEATRNIRTNSINDLKHFIEERKLVSGDGPWSSDLDRKLVSDDGPWSSDLDRKLTGDDGPQSGDIDRKLTGDDGPWSGADE
ncbi:hypothetical protein PHYBOEH_011282 [Phytophthora boehmeriae]|uniref:RxLR effector protein n=1 Tax=Phytophthora boehmeriae TaxID=109152 RepID=A0A8T1VND7_9STRA|nr:hypothetical protein PHYBOEH_011282 [Phytophthora boehmeriae]